MKTNFKKFMGVDRPKDAHPYSTHMLQGYEQGIYSKDDVLKPLLKDLRDRGGDDFMGGIQSLIDKFRKAGYSWPEFKTIEKSLGEEVLDEISLKHAAAAAVLGTAMMAPKHTAHATDVPPHRQTTTQTRDVPTKPEKIKLAPKEEKTVAGIVKRYGVDEDLAAKVVKLAQEHEYSDFPKAEDILAIVGIESSFNPAARSGLKKDPAVGLMQFRPAAWKIEPAAMTDINTQIKKGAEILHTYYRHLFSHKDRAIQAYNIGLAKYKEARDNPEENQDVLDAQKRYLAKYQHEVNHYL